MGRIGNTARKTQRSFLCRQALNRVTNETDSAFSIGCCGRLHFRSMIFLTIPVQSNLPYLQFSRTQRTVAATDGIETARST